MSLSNSLLFSHLQESRLKRVSLHKYLLSYLELKTLRDVCGLDLTVEPRCKLVVEFISIIKTFKIVCSINFIRWLRSHFVLLYSSSKCSRVLEYIACLLHILMINVGVRLESFIPIGRRNVSFSGGVNHLMIIILLDNSAFLRKKLCIFFT